jgi:S1-C subfamily serine protease
MKLLLSALLAVCLAEAGCAASALEGCPRDAVVRVEVALDPVSAGPDLARELGGREALTAYENEIARRLRVGSSGTGFLVNPQGALVTNAHVLLSGVRFRGLHFTHAEWDSMTRLLETVRDIWVSVGEGDEERCYLAVPVVIAEHLDLAVLQIVRPPGDETKFRSLPIGRAQRLAIGSPIRCCGFTDNEFRETRGEILSFLHGRTVQEPLQIVRRTHPSSGEEIITLSGTSPGPLGRLQHSAAVGHGSSGSPILDERGSVVGVGYAYLSDRRPGAEGQDGLSGLNMAIASNVLRQFLLAYSIPFAEGRP